MTDHDAVVDRLRNDATARYFYELGRVGPRALADSGTALPLDVERLTGIIEDIPPHIIKAAAGDSAEGLAAMIVARLAASSEHRDDPDWPGGTAQPLDVERLAAAMETVDAAVRRVAAAGGQPGFEGWEGYAALIAAEYERLGAASERPDELLG